MFKGKKIKDTLSKLFRRKKALYIAVAVFFISVAISGVTIAWLSDQSETIENSFQIVDVSCEIHEDFSNNAVKRDVRIENTGTMDAYIRLALIPVWKDGDNIVGVSASLSDCNINWGSAYGASWVRGSDGYYYCKLPISAGAMTPILIDRCTVQSENNYRFELQIAAQAVQAQPDSAVVNIWESATVVNPDETLEVVQ